MDDIQRLAVGKLPVAASPEPDYTRGMRTIAASLLANGQELWGLWRRPSSRPFVKRGPTCARLMLEQSMAALLGRLDPVRFVCVFRGSGSADFKLGERNSSSFSWSRDVMPGIKPGSAGLWSQDSFAKGLGRSLLEGHLADYLFGSSHSRVIELLTDETSKEAEVPDWVLQLIKFELGEHVLSSIRSKASACHSSLSKGMHFEFFQGTSTELSSDELASAIKDAIVVVATTSLYVNFSDIARHSLDEAVALKRFLSLVTKFDA